MDPVDRSRSSTSYQRQFCKYLPDCTKKKMRLRKSPDGLIRDKQLVIRITPNEHSAIKNAAMANGLSITDYVLNRCLYISLMPELPPNKELRAIATELTRQGTNLNQLAAAANRLVKVVYRNEATALEIGELVNNLQEIKRQFIPEISKAIEKCRKLLSVTDIKSMRR